MQQESKVDRNDPPENTVSGKTFAFMGPTQFCEYVVLSVPEEGRFRNNGNGTFTFDPDGAFHDVGRPRSVSFTYSAAVAGEPTPRPPVSVAVTVSRRNGNLVVSDVSYTAPQESKAAGDGSSGKTYGMLSVEPKKGFFSDNGDGTFTFFPNGDFSEGETAEFVVVFSLNDGKLTAVFRASPLDDAPYPVPYSSLEIRQETSQTKNRYLKTFFNKGVHEYLGEAVINRNLHYGRDGAA